MVIKKKIKRAKKLDAWRTYQDLEVERRPSLTRSVDLKGQELRL